MVIRNHSLYITILLLCFLLQGNLAAQTLGRVLSVDASSDSLAFLEMRNRMETIRKERPVVAVVLAGGGALGAAHIGVLEYLDEAGIPVDMVVGASMGGLVGGMYSLGFSGQQIDSVFHSVNWDVMMSDFVPSNQYTSDKRKRVEKYVLGIPFHYDDNEWIRRQSLGSSKPVREQNFVSSITEGYLYGFNIYNMLNSKTVGYQNDMSFLDLPVPFVCTATDLVTGRTKNWTDGSVVDALRSTMSIPLAFHPIRKDDKVYVDGGICNNFPVDIARAMGADIVIGVNLHLPSTLEEASSVVQLVYMSLTKPGAIMSYDNNVKDVDIYLEPDMSDYHLLSFTDSAISDLIGRGYKAAEEHKEQFDALSAKTGTESDLQKRGKTVDISYNPVVINSIEYVGLTDQEIDYFQHKLGLKAGGSYTAKDFEKAVAKVYGTGAFSHATYQLLGESEPYRFVLVCEKAPVNEFLIGLRGDTEGLLSAAFALGYNSNSLWGHRFMLSCDAGKFSSLKLDWKYKPYRAPSLNAYLQTSYSAYRGYGAAGETDRYHGEFWHNESAFFINDNYFYNADIDLGVKVECTPFLREYGEGRDLSGGGKSVWAYSYLNASYNSLDDKYFPSKGLKVSAGCEYLLGAYGANSTSKTSGTKYANLALLAPVSVTDCFAVIPSAYSRVIAGAESRMSSYYMANAIGGMMSGRYFSHQIPFIGYNGVKRVGDRLGLLGLDFRYRIMSKVYISLIGQMYNDSIGEREWKDNTVYAAAVQCSVKTLFGPVSANVHWGSDVGKLGVYLSAGFDF